MAGLSKPNYTQMPNELFDIHMQDMGFAELKVVLAILRKVVGFHKKQDEISISLLEKMTGLTRANVISGVEAATDRGLIKEVGRGKRGVKIYTVVFDDEAEETPDIDQSQSNTSDAKSEETTSIAAIPVTSIATVPDTPETSIAAIPTKESSKEKGKERDQTTLELSLYGLMQAWCDHTDASVKFGNIRRNKNYLVAAEKLLDMGVTTQEVIDCTKQQVPKNRSTAYLFWYLVQDIPTWREQNKEKVQQQKLDAAGQNTLAQNRAALAEIEALKQGTLEQEVEEDGAA